MSRRLRAASALLATAALAALTACVAAPGAGSDWAVQVYYQDLEPGACLSASFDADVALTDGFDPNAYYFEVVDCARPHLAQVVGVVDVPPAGEWSTYGTTDGPAITESDEWVTGVCRAYEVLVAAYLADAGSATTLDVSINYATIGDPRLGACLAHEPGFTTLDEAIDIDRMMAIANSVPLGADLPAFAQGWYPEMGDFAPTSWAELDDGTCVADYEGPDADTYTPALCDEPHAAQFLRWVPMPAEWGGSYAGDDAATAVVDAACAGYQASIDARPDLVTGVVVERGLIGSGYVVDGVLLAQCWARTGDGSPLTVDLAPLL